MKETDEQIRMQAVGVFESIDRDDSGTLSPSELSWRLSDFGVADELIEILFYRLDLNHDGEISKEEFVTGYGEYLRVVRGDKPQANPVSPLVLTPALTSHTSDVIPVDEAVLQHRGGKVRIHKATYGANAPSEDRSTVVAGEDFIFCGVWDGHGGTAASEHVENEAFGAFARSQAGGTSSRDAWADCFTSLDASYLQVSNVAPAEEVAKHLFAGACCTGCFVDLRENLPCPADQHELLLHSAKDLNKSGFQRSDPYCRVVVNGEVVGRTPTRNRTQSPAWQASIQLRGMLEAPQVNTVRVEIMDSQRLQADENEGYVEFVGPGLEAFAGCKGGQLGAYPVLLEGRPSGELLCQLQVPVGVAVGNLGDSRAVMGVYESGALRTVPLSTDHSALEPDEVNRLHGEHPPAEQGGDSVIDAKSGRVKGICAFTRSIGDFQMKDPGAAALYNSYRKTKVEPRPGTIVEEEEGDKLVAPYISCTPSYQEEHLCDGFVLVACDGVWDEMGSAEAVQIISELLAQNAREEEDGEDANIAEQFIEKVLEKIVVRLRATFKAERTLTLEQLKSRPPGKTRYKETHWCRSCLHDDITCVLLHFTSAAGQTAQADVACGLAADDRTSSVLAMTEAFASLDTDGSGTLTPANIQTALGLRLGQELSAEQAQAFISQADLDGSGNLVLDEFALWYEAQQHAGANLRQGGEGVCLTSGIAGWDEDEDEDEDNAGATEGQQGGDEGDPLHETDTDNDVAVAGDTDAGATMMQRTISTRGQLRRTGSDGQLLRAFRILAATTDAEFELAVAAATAGAEGREEDGEPAELDVEQATELIVHLVAAASSETGAPVTAAAPGDGGGAAAAGGAGGSNGDGTLAKEVARMAAQVCLDEVGGESQHCSLAQLKRFIIHRYK